MFGWDLYRFKTCVYFSTINTSLHFFYWFIMACCVFFSWISPKFWHSLHIFSHPMIFIVSSVILLSFCAFRILEYLVGYVLEIVCMKIIFCLCAGLILIYLCLRNSCIVYISLWHLFKCRLKYHIIFGTNRI